MRLYLQICLGFALVVVSEAFVCEVPEEHCPREPTGHMVDGYSNDRKFPEEEFQKTMAEDGNMGAMMKSEKQARQVLKKSPMLTSIDNHWFHVCPHTHCNLWLSFFWDWVYGECYVYSDVSAVRCTSRYCRYVINPFEALFYQYRCISQYRPVILLVWCQRYGFLYRLRYLPQSCCCQRYFCGNTVWPIKADYPPGEAPAYPAENAGPTGKGAASLAEAAGAPNAADANPADAISVV